MRALKIIIVPTILALAVIFIYQNAAVMRLNFLAWSFSMSASLFLIGDFFAGICLGLLLLFWNGRRDKTSLKQTRIQRDNSKTLLAGRR